MNTFTIDDQPAQTVSIIETIRNYLNDLPFGKMVTTQRISENTGVGQRQINNATATLFEYYVFIRANKNAWGNPETIKAYKNELRREP
jgi:hypothetical protein